MPDFSWIQVLLLCGLSLYLGYRLADVIWRRRRPLAPPDRYVPDSPAERSHQTPALRVLEDQFHQGKLSFEESLELAATYRKQGDLQGATEIHQSLYGLPGLDWASQQRAQFELAKDFFQAGILGRAEDLLKPLVAQGGAVTAEAVRLLIKIYKQEQNWSPALSLFEHHPRLGEGGLRWEQVHMLCEQATVLLEHSPDEARDLVRKASQVEPASNRPRLMALQIAADQGRWREVTRQTHHFLGAEFRRVDLLSPVLHQIVRRHADNMQPLLMVLQRYNQHADVRLLHGELLFQLGDTEQGIQLIESVPLTLDTLQWRLDYLADQLVSSQLRAITDELQRTQDKALNYQCGHCGYQSHSHHWYCPQCDRWETLSPGNTRHSKLLI